MTFLTPRLAESRDLGLLGPRTGNSCGDCVRERLTYREWIGRRPGNEGAGKFRRTGRSEEREAREERWVGQSRLPHSPPPHGAEVSTTCQASLGWALLVEGHLNSCPLSCSSVLICFLAPSSQTLEANEIHRGVACWECKPTCSGLNLKGFLFLM